MVSFWLQFIQVTSQVTWMVKKKTGLNLIWNSQDIQPGLCTIAKRQTSMIPNLWRSLRAFLVKFHLAFTEFLLSSVGIEVLSMTTRHLWKLLGLHMYEFVWNIWCFGGQELQNSKHVAIGCRGENKILDLLNECCIVQADVNVGKWN